MAPVGIDEFSDRPPRESHSLAARALEDYRRATEAPLDGNWALYGEELPRLGDGPGGPSKWTAVMSHPHAPSFSRGGLRMAGLLAAALSFVGAVQAAGQTAREAHTRLVMITSGADDSGPGTLRIDLGTRGSDEAFEIPARISFAPNTGLAPFRGSELTIASGLAWRRAEGGSLLMSSAKGVTVGTRRAVVNRSSFVTSVGSHVRLMRDGSGASHGTDVSTWLANGPQGLSFVAGFERAAEGAFRRKLSGNFVRTIQGRFDGAVDVAYASGGSDSWLWVSEGMTYWPRPHLQIHFSLRHERLDASLDASMFLGLTVRLDN